MGKPRCGHGDPGQGRLGAGHVQKDYHGLQPCNGRSLHKGALVSEKEGHHENMDALVGEG